MMIIVASITITAWLLFGPLGAMVYLLFWLVTFCLGFAHAACKPARVWQKNHGWSNT